MWKSVLAATLMFVFALAALGQTFSSGSTGADGALLVTSSTTVQLPASGILNYTTVQIGVGTTLTFAPNLQNTPVVILVQGGVNIGGTINVSGSGQTPGPGGFRGGDVGFPGFGPGAGAPLASGQWVGPLNLVPIIGGSGGGSASTCNGGSMPGGGGGGAIVIASSAIIAITVSGSIQANGGVNYSGCNNYTAPGTSGGGGAIRLVANSMNVSGNLDAAVVRLEAPLNAITYTGSGTSPVVATVNPEITPANPPALTIVSIGGYPVPSYSGSSFSTIDVLLPTQLKDPISVVVQATNVPVSSPVTIAFAGASGGATSTTANLSGTTASSTATVSISGVGRGGLTYLFVSTTFSASLLSSNIDTTDPHGVSKIELAAAPGGRAKYRFLQKDGSDVSIAKIPEDIRRMFGL